MARILWLADSLRSAGLTVRETSGWETRERPASTGGFAPEGVLLHHTAAYATSSDPHPSLDTVIQGRGGSDPLPGPLCHVLIDRHSVCWVVAAGRANHAGSALASGPMPAGDGNEMYVGIEVEYAATNHVPTQYATSGQKSTAIVAAARIVSRLGHGYRYVRAHKETSTTGKIDPYNWDMTDIRESVRQCLERTGW
jgi:N-acetyl-anhydromuramyl-L-alanine amidase AmpD